MTIPKVAMIVKLTYSCTPLRYSYHAGNLITLIENKRDMNPVISKKRKFENRILTVVDFDSATTYVLVLDTSTDLSILKKKGNRD